MPIRKVSPLCSSHCASRIRKRRVSLASPRPWSRSASLGLLATTAGTSRRTSMALAHSLEAIRIDGVNLAFVFLIDSAQVMLNGESALTLEAGPCLAYAPRWRPWTEQAPGPLTDLVPRRRGDLCVSPAAGTCKAGLASLFPLLTSYELLSRDCIHAVRPIPFPARAGGSFAKPSVGGGPHPSR